ncbi:MAG: hypothetical protein NPIRA05_04920 [Nitrospirales bacterium]|nr:MAG: hypothetical protein NPIRA05_04920 [Nitrospirales bacterium]
MKRNRVNQYSHIMHMKRSCIFLLVCGISALTPLDIWAASPPDEQLDCEVYKTEKYGVTAGFSVGNLLLSAGPEVTVSYERGIAWDTVVQGLIARYVEVCTRYNAGMVTKAQYAQRVQEIETIYHEAQEYERRMIHETRSRANDAFAELENMFPGAGQTPTPRKQPEGNTDTIARGLQVLGARIENLDPISRPLMPTTPCEPGDMLGSPGVRC